ncbi:MAG: hypothetical protein ACI9Y1_003292 [Lentisphaeria bacterium]|jgi:hypothetical protein
MKIDRITLERESQSKLSNEHVCAANEVPDQLLIFRVDQYENVPQNHYELFSVWISTLEDVNSGAAKEQGEILNLSSFKVRYCPFCGTDLGSPGSIEQ